MDAGLTGLVEGSYVFDLSVYDSELTANDTVTINIDPPAVSNDAPVVTAPADFATTQGASAALVGTVTDDGLPNPPAAVTASWSQVSGPGIAMFTDSTAASTTVSFDQPGTYILRLTGDDGVLSATSDVVVTVTNADLTTTRSMYGAGVTRVRVYNDSTSTVISNTVHFALAGALGSTGRTVGNDGTDSGIVRYTPYGTVRTGDVADLAVDQTFTGQTNDPGTGLIDYNARQYDPLLGKFIQPDTIVPDMANPQDLNRYMYVRGNPVNMTDPSGHCVSSIYINDEGTRMTIGVQTSPECGGRPTDPSAVAASCDTSPSNLLGRACSSHVSDREQNDYDSYNAQIVTSVRGLKMPGDYRDATDPACAFFSGYCSAQPGSSGLGFDAEIALISSMEMLSPEDFYAIATDPYEIARRGLGFLNWSNDGCSKSPDSIFGISLLGPCSQHDFSYRNRKAWEAATGENILSQASRLAADNRLGQGIYGVCDARCDFSASVFRTGVHAYGDSGPLPGVGGIWNPNVLPWDGWLPGGRWW